MKKTKLIVGMFVLFCAMALFANEGAAPADSAKKVSHEEQIEKIPGRGMIFPFGLFRGTFSLLQTPAEPFRGVATVVAPTMGSVGGALALPITIPAGLVVGTCYTLIRVLVSTADIISLGSVDFYSEMCPPFVWDSTWDTGDVD